jgi:ribosome biogenesis GTPase / thiamine phosphate phosphatase
VTLEDLGYSNWHRNKLKDLGADEAHLARIIAVDRDRFMIGSAVGALPAEASGRLLYCASDLEELPCVGDWVLVDYLDNGEHAIIHSIVPRKTLLRRRAADGRSAYQSIAANIDFAYIVQSCDVDFSLNRLDRYIVAATDGGITPRLVLTKCDLIAREQLDRLRGKVKKEHSLDVEAISSVTGAGYDGFTRALQRGRTYCLLGSSGVGKSSILNRLLGREALTIGSVREKSGKGRHTTTRRQLIVLESGALIIDTPGMRELGMMAFGAGVEESFQDIVDSAEGCRYANCTHTAEKGCAVLAKVAAGQLSAERYQSYLKLQRESEHYELTYLERREKDKAFAKMVRNYKKSNGKL